MQTNRRQDRMPATNTGFASGGVTCKFGALWIEALKKHSIRISMDGRRRAIDNIYIERFWRTIKQDYVYMNPCENGLELYKGIKWFIEYYNTKKSHQGIERQTPQSRYLKPCA